ncbi:MAG: sigma factor-like helix-turn-helix DNA-binding protein [Clostridia bacterium]
MGKQYFVKSSTGEWVSLSGKEFYAFVSKKANKSRYFFNFGEYMLEVDKNKYKQFKKENDHASYVYKMSENIEIISFSSDAISEYGNGEDMVYNKYDDIADLIFKKIRNDALDQALAQLTPEEFNLIRDLYLIKPKKTQRQIAIETGVSQASVSIRNKEVLEKLKFLVIKFEKSSQ